MSTTLRLIRHRTLGLGLTVVLLLGSVAVGLSAASTTAQAWFDRPLPGSHLAAGPVEVTAHATSVGGVDEIQLAVDGIALESQPVPDRGRLATAQFHWLPAEERGYWLTVRGRSGDQWGLPSTIFVIIGDPVPLAPGTAPAVEPSPLASPTDASPAVSPLTPATDSPATNQPTAAPTAGPTPPPATAGPRPTATPTARPTASPTPKPTAPPTPKPTAPPTPRPTAPPTPAPTARPTLPPCDPLPPLLLSPDNGATILDPSQNPVTLMWEYHDTGDCAPSGFRIQVSTARDFSTIGVAGNTGPDTWQWTTPTLPDCQTYYWRVRPKRSDGSLAGPSDVWRFELRIGRCA